MNLSGWLKLALVIIIPINIIVDLKYLKIYKKFIKELEEFEKSENVW